MAGRTRRGLLLFALALIAGGPCLGGAGATELPVQGGADGRDFRAECDRSRNQVLVGLWIRQGNFLDAIAPICSDVKAAKETAGAPVVGQAHGGSGGSPKSARCPINMAVATLMFTVTISGETRRPAHVRSLVMRCRDLPGNGAFLRSWYAMFDNEPSARPIGDPAQFVGWDNPHGKGTCPEGEIAVGIRGRAGVHVSTEGNVGRFVNALGLICGRLPVAAMGRSTIPRERTAGEAAKTPSPFVRKQTDQPEQKPPSPMQFSQPRVASQERLHFCLELPATACGELPAKAFCQSKGYAQAAAFNFETGRIRSETWFGEICAQNDCRVFGSITCAH